MFANEKALEEYNAKIYKTDPYFYKNYNEELKVDKNGHEYIRFRTDVYFPDYYNLAVEVDEIGHTDRDLIFEKKRQKALEKKIGCKLIRANRNRENYDLLYETGRIKAFISDFQNKKLK